MHREWPSRSRNRYPRTPKEVFLSFIGVGDLDDLDRAIGIITGFFLFTTIVVGLPALFLLYVAPWKSWAPVVGFALLLAGGAVVSAFLLGFLFGMPRVVETQTKDQHTGSHQGVIRASANLEQIADWLTKIMVGLGIAEFPKVIAYATRFLIYVDPVHQGSQAFGIIFFFAPPGFLLGYFYARTFFTRLFAEV